MKFEPLFLAIYTNFALEHKYHKEYLEMTFEIPLKFLEVLAAYLNNI